MILYVDVKLTCIAVLPLILIIFGDYFYGKLMHRRFIRKQKAFSDLTDQVQEAVSGIRVIKAFVQEHKELAAFAVTNKNNQEKNLSVVRLQALFVPRCWIDRRNQQPADSALRRDILPSTEHQPGTVCGIQFLYRNAGMADDRGRRMYHLCVSGSCIPETYYDDFPGTSRILWTVSEVKPVEHLEGDLVFDHLTFSYPGESNAPALSDICLHVEKGSTLAVLGRTGSGKTTLANLLMRLYDVKSGMIRIDGHALKHIPLRVLRGDIAYVPQDNFLFSDTLENNIAFGVAEKDPEAVRQAARDACIHDNIMDFPDNYQTMVGERGVTLSGVRSSEAPLPGRC